MYKWEVKKVAAADLEKTLDTVPAKCEVFAVLPYGTDGENFLVIVKCRKSA